MRIYMLIYYKLICLSISISLDNIMMKRASRNSVEEVKSPRLDRGSTGEAKERQRMNVTGT